MNDIRWLWIGIAAGAFGVILGQIIGRRLAGRRTPGHPQYLSWLLQRHFRPAPVDALSIAEREFPLRVRADIQSALDGLVVELFSARSVHGLRHEYSPEGIRLANCTLPNHGSPTQVVPAEYEDVDVGGDVPVRVLKSGMWLLSGGGSPCAVLVAPCGYFRARNAGISVQVATPQGAAGADRIAAIFQRLEAAVASSSAYRGKVLSLEDSDQSYSGESTGVKVHRLTRVGRDDLILPQATLDLLERNVIRFVAQRPRLTALGQSTRKGLLFHGPPGVGKTHTIHYLIHALSGHTTLLITGEQVGLLPEYMKLARLLQPSLVVMEDVDLIARDRASMGSPCEESLLNRLLNEMDGLQRDAEILFVLTTNRPDMLEAALASRPGRIDQAVEFPLPNDEGRLKLLQLYSRSTPLSPADAADVVRRTDGVSGAFIKELMRRSVQYMLERGGNGLRLSDVHGALDELLTSGGRLNRKLLGSDKAIGFRSVE
jgi:hypothetical protein